jgi:hypothetical protein
VEVEQIFGIIVVLFCSIIARLPAVAWHAAARSRYKTQLKSVFFN